MTLAHWQANGPVPCIKRNTVCQFRLITARDLFTPGRNALTSRHHGPRATLSASIKNPCRWSLWQNAVVDIKSGKFEEVRLPCISPVCLTGFFFPVCNCKNLRIPVVFFKVIPGCPRTSNVCGPVGILSRKWLPLCCKSIAVFDFSLFACSQKWQAEKVFKIECVKIL